MMELKYFKTDKNGTKYFYDWNCPRCSGAGFCDKWAYTGRFCFACGGTGKRSQPKIVKEYTDEYAAKLAARHASKVAKQVEEAKRYAEEHADEIEAQNRRIIEERYAEFGCGKDGVGYVLSGNTYKIKEQIKANGGKWIYGVWVCPVEMKCVGVSTRKVDLNGHIGAGSIIWLDGFDFYEAVRG
jgi:hypothetical protein